MGSEVIYCCMYSTYVLMYASGGGGGTSICKNIGYVPRERPPFSALNVRSGAYHFHKLPKNPFRSITILHFFGGFCRSGDHHFQNFFNFNQFIASHGRFSSHFHAQNGSSSFRSPAFSRSKRLKLVPEPRIFKLKTAQARSGAPHFHARLGARSGALAHFSLYLPKFGVSTPPPPLPGAKYIFPNRFIYGAVLSLWTQTSNEYS